VEHFLGRKEKYFFFMILEKGQSWLSFICLHFGVADGQISPGIDQKDASA